jgi:hypothetical protein
LNKEYHEIFITLLDLPEVQISLGSFALSMIQHDVQLEELSRDDRIPAVDTGQKNTAQKCKSGITNLSGSLNISF